MFTNMKLSQISLPLLITLIIHLNIKLDYVFIDDQHHNFLLKMSLHSRRNQGTEKGQERKITFPMTMATLHKKHLCSSNITRSAVFFDLDNTLIETRKGDSQTCRKLAEELVQEYGIPADVSVKITTTYLKLFRRCPDNVIHTLDAWRITLWSKALGEKYSYLAKKIYERWLYLRYYYLTLASDVVSMLRQLRVKYLLGLITNGPSNAQWEKIRKLSLEQYFDIILVSGDLPWEKPEREIFRKACRFLNVKPDTCVMVGDKLETDILGGIEAGLGGTIWIPTLDKRPLLREDPQPDFTIRHVTDLLSIFK